MFDTKQIDLSMRNPDTGRFLQANVYFVEGVTNADGSYRELSIGQLVMAICLARATEVEQTLVLKMDAMNQASLRLDSLTEIEAKIAETAAENNVHAPHSLFDETVVEVHIAFLFGCLCHLEE